MPGPKFTEGLPPLQPIIDSLVAHSGVTLLVLVVLVMLMLATLVSVGVRLRRMERLWRNISGLCLPRYVLDCAGGGGKILL